ncbi:type II toxin-antitoxin system VapC family toxin [Microbacterium alcoholitolerans]|uniref:type II toxin-antitoxin system VapC family toxin n=1 Tax=unclassified Microbacterium TaxID=2609290 RepID=UPI003D17EDF1
MIVDSSAFVAVLLDEPDAALLRSALAAETVKISAATLTECSIVLQSKPARGLADRFEELLHSTNAKIVPVDERIARGAIDAHRRYGRGSGHPAKLNYGDCFSYALAIAHDEPLLFTGDDFIHTDVRVATSEV